MKKDVAVLHLVIDYKNVGNFDDLLDLVESIRDVLHCVYVKHALLDSLVTYQEWEDYNNEI